MSKVVRYDFLGSWLLFWAACITGVLIPIGVLYLITGIIRTETEMDRPEEFVEAYRAGRIKTT
jgi:hypothetical protein